MERFIIPVKASHAVGQEGNAASLRALAARSHEPLACRRIALLPRPHDNTHNNTLWRNHGVEKPFGLIGR